MRTIVFTILVLSLSFVSCENKKTEENSTTPESVVSKDSPFTVKINALILKDDIFNIYYNEDGKDVYLPEQVVIIETKGNNTAQDIVFELPKDVMPMNLRFDLGSNKDQKSIKINSFQMDYMGKSFATKSGGEFIKYFSPNPQIVFDAATSSANIVIDETVMYDPIFFATPDLKKEIENLYKK